MVNNSDMLFYTFAFVVPGFITHSIISMFMPQKSEQAPNSILRYLYFSSINYALWSWLIFILVKSNYHQIHRYRAAAIWGVIILISPIITGIVLGIFSKHEFIRKLLQKTGFNLVHPIPTGWDYKFSTLKNGAWIIITLKDDTLITGYFGENSFASSDSPERDIYIEKVYKICEDGPWQEIERTDGILIKGDQIKLIEFKKQEAE